MLRGLRTLPLWQRRIVFIMIFGGALVFLVALTLFLITQTLFISRSQPQGTAGETSVREFVTLPGDNAYPATVAAGSTSLYTGSFSTGAVWQINAQGALGEIPNSRDTIGSVSGLAVAADDSLIVVDILDTDPRSAGGTLWRIGSDGNITPFAGPDAQFGWVAPDDVAIDSAGRVYVSDYGLNEVIRFAPDGSSGETWWLPPPAPDGTANAITGLAYDPLHDAILITDPNRNMIYRVGVESGETEILYEHGAREFAPGFDGITTDAEGTVYVAALGQNGVARVDDGNLHYVGGFFRGSSDVTYFDGKLYVTNFDQSSLVLPVRPSLPFSIDEISFVPASALTPTPGN